MFSNKTTFYLPHSQQKVLKFFLPLNVKKILRIRWSNIHIIVQMYHLRSKLKYMALYFWFSFTWCPCRLKHPNIKSHNYLLWYNLCLHPVYPALFVRVDHSFDRRPGVLWFRHENPVHLMHPIPPSEKWHPVPSHWLVVLRVELVNKKCINTSRPAKVLSNLWLYQHAIQCFPAITVAHKVDLPRFVWTPNDLQMPGVSVCLSLVFLLTNRFKLGEQTLF